MAPQSSRSTLRLNFVAVLRERFPGTEVHETGAESLPFAENDFDLAFNLRYAITPHLGIDLGYNRFQIISGIPQREYSRNRVYGGLNFTF